MLGRGEHDRRRRRDRRRGKICGHRATTAPSASPISAPRRRWPPWTAPSRPPTSSWPCRDHLVDALWRVEAADAVPPGTPPAGSSWRASAGPVGGSAGAGRAAAPPGAAAEPGRGDELPPDGRTRSCCARATGGHGGDACGLRAAGAAGAPRSSPPAAAPVGAPAATGCPLSRCRAASGTRRYRLLVRRHARGRRGCAGCGPSLRADVEAGPRRLARELRTSGGPGRTRRTVTPSGCARALARTVPVIKVAGIERGRRLAGSAELNKRTRRLPPLAAELTKADHDTIIGGGDATTSPRSPRSCSRTPSGSKQIAARASS